MVLQATLDGNPNGSWIDCFRHPKTYRGNEILGMEVKGNTIIFRERESQVKETVAWVDNYINQANVAYKAKVEEQQTRLKKQKEIEDSKESRLEKISESLKDL